MHPADSVDVLVVHIGHGNIIAEKEREPGVVVLEVEGFPHSLRKLVDEAEDALVGAAMLFVHEVGLEFEADVLVLLLPDAKQALPPVAVEHEVQDAVHQVETIVQHVGDGMAVD